MRVHSRTRVPGDTLFFGLGKSAKKTFKRLIRSVEHISWKSEKTVDDDDAAEPCPGREL